MKYMSQFEYAIIGAVLFVVVGTAFVSYRAITDGAFAASILACTAEAKICPDGSAVGRMGPTCDFALCPVAVASTTTATTTANLPKLGGAGGENASIQSGIRGTISLGPTCPVEHNPPDPSCADRPYTTAVSVARQGSSVAVATAKSDAIGVYEISLPPGNYTVSAKGGDVLPRCSPIEVTVSPKEYVTAAISCDTGIR